MFLGLWYSAQLSFTHPEETQAMLLLPWLHSLPMPLVAVMRATGCAEIQGLPCLPCSAPSLCWQVGATSAPVNHKPHKAGQAKRAHSFPLCCLTFFFKTVHSSTIYKIPHNFSALLRLHVLVMAFGTRVTEEKIQARDAVLGLAIAATKVLKLLVHA